MSGAGTKLENQTSAQPLFKLRALLVEDNALDAALVVRALCKDGFDVTADVVQDEAAFTRMLRTHPPEVVLADYNLPSWTGMAALDVLRREGLDIPLILVSGALGDLTAVDCIKRGATDYVLKDGLARLPETIRRALQEKHLRQLRRQAEEELAQKAVELARSNADLEQFAYVASHDLQEPLRMVAAYTQLLAERYRGKLDADADKFIGYATDGALRMQVLIQDLLAFSRVGRSGASSASVDCNAIMQEVLQTLAPAIQESGTVVTCASLPSVWADRTQLAQVFQNLVGNAIKFRQEAPPIISVQAEKVGPEWLFSIRDNGIGIAPESAENIFVVFQRLHARTEYPGNGIGLAICKKIIERYGGRIWVESQGDCGSTFKFTMPVHDIEKHDIEKHDLKEHGPYKQEGAKNEIGAPIAVGG
jgi:signal transduction histidine kinase